MPIGSQILTLDLKDGDPCIWVKCDSENDVEDVNFITVGTGSYIADGNSDFIGTYQLPGSNNALHVFKVNINLK